jgi:ABC-type thiamin/hydroxymethylpyrimidine transport system permease subunit
MSWNRAVAVTVVVVVVAYLALAVVPDYLVTSLSGRVDPVVRDLLVGIWTLAAVVGVTWLLSRAQRREVRP